MRNKVHNGLYYALTIAAACWCMRMSGCVSGILERISVYFGQPDNSMAGNRTTAMSPDVFGPEMRNFTHCASSTTAIRRSLGSGNLLEPVFPKQTKIVLNKAIEKTVTSFHWYENKLQKKLVFLGTYFFFVVRIYWRRHCVERFYTKQKKRFFSFVTIDNQIK